MKTQQKIRFATALATALAVPAVFAFAESEIAAGTPAGDREFLLGGEDVLVPVEISAVPADANSGGGVSVSVESASVRTQKTASRESFEMSGFDVRLNFAAESENEFSLGLMLLNGSENPGPNTDFATTETAVFAGYRLVLPLVSDRLKAYTGAHVGMIYPGDEYAGSSMDLKYFRSDGDTAAAYVAEFGLSYSFSESWSLRGGYEYYVDAARMGNGGERDGDREYHSFRLGAEYQF